MPLTKEEQIRKTQEHIYEMNGLQQSGFIGTARSIFWLTAGYFVDYEKYKLYKQTLFFVMDKMEKEAEAEEEEREN